MAGGSSGRSVGGAVFCSIFLLFGLGFTWLLGSELLHIIDSYSWDEVQCQISKSEVADRGGENPYHFDVRYTYSYKGRSFVGTDFEISNSGSSEYRTAQHLVDIYPVGRTAKCFVNPNKPEEAIIEHSSLWFGLFLLIPLVFILIGGGGVYFCLKGGATRSESVTSISDSASSSWSGRTIGVIFFGVFFLVGLGTGYPLLVRPFEKYQDSKKWLVLDCKVESSNVRSHSSDDGTTYSVDILYRYEVQGRQYKSNTYDFIGGSSSGYESKRKIVNEHPKGKKVPCYVNPNDPAEAVLDREIGFGFLLGLIPLIFGSIGAIGMYYCLTGGRKSGRQVSGVAPDMQFSQATSAEWLPLEPATTFSAAAGMPILKPSSSPVGRLIGMILVAAFITGIVSVFANEVWTGWSSGNPDWFLTLFISPFLLMVLASWFGILYFFLALWNPRPEVSIQTVSPKLGESVSIRWRLTGKTSAIQKFDVYLEGVEEAQYRRGTTTYTDRSKFARIPIAENLSAMHASGGEASFTIPADTMHSFVASNNKIVWTLNLKGEIARWPDISESFTLRVLPGKQSGGTGGLW
ncbi:MAG: DUF3592 domain-containing protein [Bdellovibrionales bacterium]|nr:DUF3592 domain-containing protein [Bdellovibrionales bacterium]